MFYRIMLIIVAMTSVITVSTITLSASNEHERKIVVFEKSIIDSDMGELLKKHQAEKIKNLPAINGAVVNLPKKNSLKSEKAVSFIEEDFVVCINSNSLNKPQRKPGIQPTLEVIPWGIEWMKAPEYWNHVETDNVKIGVLDTGIDLKHPDLSGNIKGGFNAIRKNKPANDDNGHGTHVAGIIAASKNGFGVVGMAPDVDLYSVKVLDNNGNGYISDIIEGIDWAIKNNINILNMSFGTINASQSLHEIIVKANNAGIVMVAAAGNNYGKSCEYPAAYPEVISVGAIGKDGSISDFSAQVGVDIFAPGADIYSTYMGSDYREFSGTSMAAPHVAGRAALLLNNQ